MKTELDLENQEIGELLREISEKGFTGLVTDVCDVGNRRFVSVTVTDYLKLEAGEAGAEFTVETSSLVEAFRQIVDMIRTERGEPTLAEEVAAMILKEEEHEKARIVCGPGARCSCGSGMLIIKREIAMVVELETGEVSFGENPARFDIQTGEIARCWNCGAWYQLNA